MKNASEPTNPRWVVIWLALFGFFWALFSWLVWLIYPNSTMPSWLQAINFAFAWCFLIAWNRRHPERRPKAKTERASPVKLLRVAATIAAVVALISAGSTLWLKRPGWVATMLYSLGLPVVILGVGFTIEKWGRLADRDAVGVVTD